MPLPYGTLLFARIGVYMYIMQQYYYLICIIKQYNLS